MSAEQNIVATAAEARVHEQPAGVYASLLKKIHLAPVEQLSDISACMSWRVMNRLPFRYFGMR